MGRVHGNQKIDARLLRVEPLESTVVSTRGDGQWFPGNRVVLRRHRIIAADRDETWSSRLRAAFDRAVLAAGQSRQNQKRGYRYRHAPHAVDSENVGEREDVLGRPPSIPKTAASINSFKTTASKDSRENK